MTFSDRQRTLFDTLVAAEESRHAGRQKNRNYRAEGSDGFHRGLSRKMRSETRQFRGRKSMYLKPEDSIFQCLGVRTLPDFKKNPSKWTHYNLEDVPEVTDRSNAHAAAVCMQEIMLAKQKDGELMDCDKPIDDDKVIFKVPARPPCISISQSSEKKVNTLYRSSKIILPEYVVGRREKHKLSNLDRQQDLKSQRSELKLEHLLDDDGDEDNDIS